jgi:hypothetical protein
MLRLNTFVNFSTDATSEIDRPLLNDTTVTPEIPNVTPEIPNVTPEMVVPTVEEPWFLRNGQTLDDLYEELYEQLENIPEVAVPPIEQLEDVPEVADPPVEELRALRNIPALDDLYEELYNLLFNTGG